MNLIDCRAVTRYFSGGVTALDRVDFFVPEGAVYGLVGRNGAGKSTLLRMLPGLLQPSKGEVRVFGLDPWQEPVEVKRQLGYLSESEAHPPTLKVRHLTELHASVYPKWDPAMATRLLEQFGLRPEYRLSRLSKGQKRQVGLMLTVCHRPRLLVLDEPASGLDPATRREFLEVIIRLLVDTGSTVLFSSHILSDLERVADHLAILHQGYMLLQKPLDEIKENICRAVLDVGADREAVLARLDAESDCLRVTVHEGACEAILLWRPEEIEPKLHQVFSGSTVPVVRQKTLLTLEDIFIELTRDRS